MFISCRIMSHHVALKPSKAIESHRKPSKVRGTVDFNEVQIVPSRHGNAESREAIRTTGLVARRLDGSTSFTPQFLMGKTW